MSGRAWTDADVELMRSLFANCRTDDLAAALGRTYRQVAMKAQGLGLKKSAEYLAGPDAHRLDGKKGEGSRFLIGHSTWNKGVKGSTGVQEACRATQFKPGRPAYEARNYQPIGALRISKDGYLERKTTDDPLVYPSRRWVAVHRLVWEAHNGTIPAQMIVVFKRGMKTTELVDVTIDRLECITRRENMLRNTYHRFGPEIAKAIQLRSAISRQINKRAKHEQDHQ